MDDFADLRRAILAEPDDDQVRLVFADLLEEQGDPDRAEFLRLQIRMAGAPEWLPGFAALRRRERELIVANGRKWRAGLPRFPGIEWGPFIRGFIGGVEARRWSDFLASADAIFAQEPVQHLEIRFYLFPMLAEMKSAEVLARLAGLDLSLITLQSGDVAELLRSPHLARLRKLSLGRDQLTDAAGVEIFGSPVLGQLRKLKVGGNRFTHVSLGELARGTRPLLESLNLSNNPLGLPGMHALAAAKNLDRLSAIDLSGCEIGDEGVEILTGASWVPNLRILDLTNNRIGAVGAELLASADQLNDVVRLDLRYNRVPASQRDALLERFGERVWLSN